VSSQQVGRPAELLRVAAVADSRTRRPAVRRFRCPERSRKAPTRWRTEGLIGSGGLAHHPRGVMACPPMSLDHRRRGGVCCALAASSAADRRRSWRSHGGQDRV